MTAAPATRAQGLSLGRATATLMMGGAVAQGLPLLLGPWLTRLYTPEQWGTWQLFAAVAATLGVVACARYEFALPLARDDDEARALRSLALTVLTGATVLGAITGLVWAAHLHAGWPLWLPVAMASLGAVSLATMVATRAQRLSAVSLASAVQHGGGSLLQALAGLAGLGLQGLIVAPLVAAWLAVGSLGLAWRDRLPWRDARVREAAHRHRDFAWLNTPHALLGTLVAAVAVAMITASQGPAAAGFWGLALRYLMAPATLVGGALSQALYARLAADAASHDGRVSVQARQDVRRVMRQLAPIALAWVAVVAWAGPWVFERAFGAAWADAGVLARALAVYIGLHFMASPLGVVTMAWRAQRFGLVMAAAGGMLFLASIAAGLAWRGLEGAGWALACTMPCYFGWYLWRLATWPVDGDRA